MFLEHLTANNTCIVFLMYIEEAYYNCENYLSSFFKSYVSLTITYMYFSNCEGGIQIFD